MARAAKRYRGFVSFVLSSFLFVAALPIAAAAEGDPSVKVGESAGPARPTPPVEDVVAPTGAAEAASTPVTLPPLPPPPPEGKPLFDPKIGVGAWIRIGGRLENPNEPQKLNDFFMDQLYLVAAIRGQFTPWLKWQAGLAATHFTPPSDPSLDAELVIPQAGLQDLIVKFEPHDLFNIWVGKMLLPVDRSNLSGPWFINYWMMRGVFPRLVGTVPAPYGVKSGPFGRDQGITAWGQVEGGKFKYYLGTYGLDNQSMSSHPMFAGRLVLNLLDPEPGYFNQSAYHGEKDILAFGVGGQYQDGASVTVIPAANPALEVGNLRVFTFDVLLDKKLGGMQAVTFEAGGSITDKFQPVSRLFFAGVGYVSAPLGPVRLAPAARVQIGRVPPIFDAVTNPTGREPGLDLQFNQVDGYIQILVKSHFAKILVGGFWSESWRPSDMPGTPRSYARGVQIGVQVIGL
jgi:hypothetical protein